MGSKVPPVSYVLPHPPSDVHRDWYRVNHNYRTPDSHYIPNHLVPASGMQTV